jgi:hypothetical protein
MTRRGSINIPGFSQRIETLLRFHRSASAYIRSASSYSSSGGSEWLAAYADRSSKQFIQLVDILQLHRAHQVLFEAVQFSTHSARSHVPIGTSFRFPNPAKNKTASEEYPPSGNPSRYTRGSFCPGRNPGLPPFHDHRECLRACLRALTWLWVRPKIRPSAP